MLLPSICLHPPVTYSFLDPYLIHTLSPANRSVLYGGADKSLARPTSRYSLFDGENISFDASPIIIYK